jgi:hypothetical protein
MRSLGLVLWGMMTGAKGIELGVVRLPWWGGRGCRRCPQSSRQTAKVSQVVLLPGFGKSGVHLRERTERVPVARPDV